MAAGYYDISDPNVATTSTDQRGSGISGPGAIAFRFFAATRGVVSLSLVFALPSESKEPSESSPPEPLKYAILPLRSGPAPYGSHMHQTRGASAARSSLFCWAMSLSETPTAVRSRPPSSKWPLAFMAGP